MTDALIAQAALAAAVAWGAGFRLYAVVLALGLLGWFGWYYVVDSKISAEMIKFDVVSATEVQVHLEVRKDEGVEGVCTLRSRAEDGTEVARKDVRIDDPAARVDQVFSLRTTARATSAELIGCTTR